VFRLENIGSSLLNEENILCHNFFIFLLILFSFLLSAEILKYVSNFGFYCLTGRL
jgi:hypothetical protein